jgi:hypothetical protein
MIIIYVINAIPPKNSRRTEAKEENFCHAPSSPWLDRKDTIWKVTT